MWQQLLLLVLAIFLGWLVYRNVKTNPQAFSKSNLSKSVWTMGCLALFLIAFIALLILLVRA